MSDPGSIERETAIGHPRRFAWTCVKAIGFGAFIVGTPVVLGYDGVDATRLSILMLAVGVAFALEFDDHDE